MEVVGPSDISEAIVKKNFSYKRKKNGKNCNLLYFVGSSSPGQIMQLAVLHVAGLLLLLCNAAATPAAARNLVDAVNRDDAPAVRAAVAAGANINARGGGGQTPLMQASLSGKPAAAAALLALGADPTIGEKDGYTPLHGAAFQGRAELVRMLLADGRVPNEAHRDGFWPVHRACWGREQRHADAVAAFLAAQPEAALLRARQSGETPLDIARGRRDARLVRVIEAAMTSAGPLHATAEAAEGEEEL